MKRPLLFALLVALGLLALGYGAWFVHLAVGGGSQEEPGDAAGWTARADEALAEGDRLAGEPAGVPEAVECWRRAGAGYLKAFRLEDPVAERRETRALLAFRTARAWSKAARLGAEPRARALHADRALFWFAHARQLEPALHQAHFERARLFDSDIDEVRDPTRALEGYRAYLTAAGAGASDPSSEAERLRLARERVEALAGAR